MLVVDHLTLLIVLLVSLISFFPRFSRGSKMIVIIIIIIQRQCLWCCPHDHGHCESSPGSFDECRLSAGWPPTLRLSQPTWAVSPPINGCYHPHPPSPFVIITQPESWYSFFRPTEGGRLSRPRHCRKGAQPVPKAVHCSGCRDKHNWQRPLTPQSIMPLLNHCDLLRHVGVNNLPKVITR